MMKSTTIMSSVITGAVTVRTTLDILGPIIVFKVIYLEVSPRGFYSLSDQKEKEKGCLE